MTGRLLLRRTALNAAVEFVRGDECVDEEVLAVADAFYAWLIQPASLTLAFGQVAARNESTDSPRTPGASAMANLQLGDTDQVTATAVALDADGNPTSDTLTWAASPATAVSLAPSTDTMSCVIGGLVPTVGVAITATDSLGNTTSGDVDVVAGPATSLSLQFGPVTPRPAAAPAATPTAAPAAASTEPTGSSSTP